MFLRMFRAVVMILCMSAVVWCLYSALPQMFYASVVRSANEPVCGELVIENGNVFAKEAQYDGLLTRAKMKLIEYESDSSEYQHTFVCSDSAQYFRSVSYGKSRSGGIEVVTWDNTRMLSYDDMRDTAEYVLYMMDNLPQSEAIVDLILETCMVQSAFGSEVSVGRYGIFNLDTETVSKVMLWLLTANRPDVYHAVLSLYNDNMSLEENLSCNVPFQTAVVYQLYWMYVPDLQSNVKSGSERALLWRHVMSNDKSVDAVDNYLYTTGKLTAALGK